jgi:cation transporter-like permease
MWRDWSLRVLRYALLLLSAGYLAWLAYVAPGFRAYGIDTIVPLVQIAILALAYLVLFLCPPSGRPQR